MAPTSPSPDRGETDPGRLRTEWLRYRSQLSDPLTGFPTLPAVIEQARQLLARAGALEVLYLDLGRSGAREARMGWEAYDETIRGFARRVEALREDRRLAPDELVCVRTVRSDRVIVFLAATAQAPSGAEAGSRVQGLLERLRVGGSGAGGSAFGAGFARVVRDPMVRTERAIHRGVTRAMLACLGARGERRVERLRDLVAVIEHEAVRTVFHPVVRIASGQVLGHEALTRPVSHTSFDSVEDLFAFAETTDRQLDFERVCRLEAIRSVGERGLTGFLFLNSSGRGLSDPEWLAPELSGLLAESGLVPNQVVIEIPERLVVESGPGLQRAAAALKKRGYRIAVDDMGAGYARFQIIAELHPDFLKFDVGLVRGVDASRIKQDLGRALCELAARLGALVIAEGVETPAERDALRAIGFDIAQGRLFKAEEVG